MKEYGISISGMSTLTICRNQMINCGGQFIAVLGASDVTIESNLVHDNVIGGLYAYVRRIFGFDDTVARNLIFRGNTIVMNGTFSSSQEVLAISTVKNLVNCNNIIINPENKCYCGILVNNGITDSYVSYNNIYASAFYNNNPELRWSNFSPFRCGNNKPEEGYLNLSFAEQNRLLSSIQAGGYEEGSWAVTNTATILGGDYKMLPTVVETYKAKLQYLPEFDIDYKIVTTVATVGAYNMKGVIWDENTDTNHGYVGINTVDGNGFSDASLYQAPDGDIIVLKINTRKRSTLFKTTLSPETGDKILAYGKFATLSLKCVSENGMYIENNPYDIEIEQLSYE